MYVVASLLIAGVMNPLPQFLKIDEGRGINAHSIASSYFSERWLRLYFPKYLISRHFATGRRERKRCFTDFSRDDKTWAWQISGICQLEALGPSATFFWTITIQPIYSLKEMGRTSLQIFNRPMIYGTVQ